MWKIIFLIIFLPLNSCGQNPKNQIKNVEQSIPDEPIIIKNQGLTIIERFNPPKGFKRVNVGVNEFGTFLRTLPLKPSGSVVKYYNGNIKSSNNVYCAVVDLPIGNRDLHQCADAIIRLRADFLRKTDQINNIHFEFTNGFIADYSKWIKGNRIQVRGKNVRWVPGGTPGDSDEKFWEYLEIVFSYAGTLSLSRELEEVKITDMKIGDILIQGGSPGHAVILVDMVENIETGQKLVMLAQSYMPAQEIQILLNPLKTNNPWYEVKEGVILTPEWKFNSKDLKRF
ncbi:DUF4846 domain-containing protein [Mangrovivirga cuniculi]|nr:DUF4846 domain-containing protein [Mangrovivirga cuniculi]